MGPRNHVLDGGPDHLWEGAVLRGKGQPIVKYRDYTNAAILSNYVDYLLLLLLLFLLLLLLLLLLNEQRRFTDHFE